MPDRSIRLVMVESRPLMGTGVREVLDRAAGIEVVGQVGSADEAREVVDSTAPDVVLIDTSLEEPSGSVATRRLRRETPDAAFVVLGGHDDDASIIEAVEIGARAHISEVAQPAELVEIIRRVAFGDYPLHDELQDRPDLLERVLADLRDTPTVADGEPNPLTPHEIELLQHVAKGLKNREIAERFEVAEQTVKNSASRGDAEAGRAEPDAGGARGDAARLAGRPGGRRADLAPPSHSPASAVTSSTISWPYRASRDGPMPLMRRSAGMVVGRWSTISISSESGAMT